MIGMFHQAAGTVASLVLCLVMAQSALAQDVWVLPWGEMVHEADVGDTAIWSYPSEDEQRGYIYLPDLAGRDEGLSEHLGYWIEDSQGWCPATLTGADGLTSNSWGRILVVFDQETAPSAWTMVASMCLEDFDDEGIRGELPG